MAIAFKLEQFCSIHVASDRCTNSHCFEQLNWTALHNLPVFFFSSFWPFRVDWYVVR